MRLSPTKLTSIASASATSGGLRSNPEPSEPNFGDRDAPLRSGDAKKPPPGFKYTRNAPVVHFVSNAQASNSHRHLSGPRESTSSAPRKGSGNKAAMAGQRHRACSLGGRVTFWAIAITTPLQLGLSTSGFAIPPYSVARSHSRCSPVPLCRDGTGGEPPSRTFQNLFQQSVPDLVRDRSAVVLTFGV